ncbi:Signal recognition particle subunit-like protein [Emericellopsis cladophorae]|uniref:Signal recognition particle subunit SRP68 n=1 Tax=Emericellopsis cladophorae TaxID=2686198 RepID=A0A9P9Y855_9HYPO|nr:Signal recognition particle subunit-like protein [Emericellopsis cladophorae]KAI6785118.1 Signal recognition particle subunit-like protein [Emericellopsis cladophorae]
MDITTFVVQGRDKALLYVHLLLLTSERAWAQAMGMKSSHASDDKGLNSHARSHVVSRLTKAARAAEELVEALGATDESGASTTDVLEAQAYAAMIQAAMCFEKHSWEACLRNYATAWVVYSALQSSTKTDIYKELLSETIDPSIRYAAYQLKTPRTTPIPVIAHKAFPQSDSALVENVNQLDPTILKQADASQDAKDGESIPQTLTWRSREVKIEDAQIAEAWAAVIQAKKTLSEKVKEIDDDHHFEKAAAYDEILAATGDAVDATKTAIDELRAEGVGSGDPRMQSLQITRTAVNYEMVSWRIGRNRVLTGGDDGAAERYGHGRRRRNKAKAKDEPLKDERELPTSKKLHKLKEKVALYDGTLQNLRTIKELPGVAADEELAAKLDASVKYFEALSNLSIARSHSLVGNVTNALALINHSLKLSEQASSRMPNLAHDPTRPVNVDVSAESIASLSALLTGELQRHRAIVHIDNIRKEEIANAHSGSAPSAAKVPLVDRLYDYPIGGVDLANVVEFPPKRALIPVKPIFLDVAWNYIGYPGKDPLAASDVKAQSAPSATGEQVEQKPEEKQSAKRGWFGFGRS